MERLPTEMLVHILGFLGAKDAVTFCCSHKNARQVAKEHAHLLLKEVECDGDIIAEKLGGLYVPNNEPLEKQKEEMKAKFLIDPLGRAQKKLEFEGEYGSSCFWTVKDGRLDGPFRCEMETPFEYALIEEGNFRRGKLHGISHSFNREEQNFGKWTTWYRGQKKRERTTSENKVCVKEWRTSRTRKKRTPFLEKQKETFFLQRFSRYSCSGKDVDSWSYTTETKRNGARISEYSSFWMDGDSTWRYVVDREVVSEGTEKSNSCVIGRCCERHGKQLEEAMSGEWKAQFF